MDRPPRVVAGEEQDLTRDDIIRMAREAECEETWGMDAFRFSVEELERFAALVAAAKRDSMMADGWRQCAQGQKTTQFCAVAEQVRLEEREACARVCDDLAKPDIYTNYYRIAARAIRARGQQQEPDDANPSF